MTALDHALELIEFGLFVLPVDQKKVPRLPGWQNSATSDPDMVKRWWTEDYRGSGVGIAHRLSGTVAVDLDRHHAGEDGVAAMARVLESGLPWPATANYQTPNGHQYLFSRPDSGDYSSLSGNITKSAELGFDPGVQLIWGQSVAPSGDATPGRLWARTVWDAGIATLPTWVHAELDAARAKQRVERKSFSTLRLPMPGSADRDRTYCTTAINATADRIASAPDGSRQQTLHDQALFCGRALGRKAMASMLAEAESVLIGAAPWVDTRHERSTLTRALEQGYKEGEREQ